VEGHTGRLVCGKVDTVPVLAMQGRVHYYEGYSLEEVTFPVRTFKLLGIKTLVLTNAAGGINVQLTQGALMVISDHVNLLGDNPLRGPNDERFGPRFPDMSVVYSPALQELVVEEAKAIGASIGGFGAGSDFESGTSAEAPAAPRRRGRKGQPTNAGEGAAI
jgi:purine-nucleoside phosphorylase